MSVKREREGSAAVRPVSWRAEEVKRGAIAESEHETMLVWESQTMESSRTKEDNISVIRHSVSPLCGVRGAPALPTTRVVAMRLPRVS